MKRSFHWIIRLQILSTFAVVLLRTLLFLDVKINISANTANLMVLAVFGFSFLTYSGVMLYAIPKIMNNPSKASTFPKKVISFLRATLKAPFKYDDILRGDP